MELVPEVPRNLWRGWGQHKSRALVAVVKHVGGGPGLGRGARRQGRSALLDRWFRSAFLCLQGHWERVSGTYEVQVRVLGGPNGVGLGNL